MLASRRGVRAKKDRQCGGLSELQYDEGQATAAALRFLRQPTTPMTPRPPANNGKAAGNGVELRLALIAVESREKPFPPKPTTKSTVSPAVSGRSVPKLAELELIEAP